MIAIFSVTHTCENNTSQYERVADESSCTSNRLAGRQDGRAARQRTVPSTTFFFPLFLSFYVQTLMEVRLMTCSSWSS